MRFVHLRVRSAFSLLEGASTPDALCRAAAARGFSGLALTDRNGLYGLPAFGAACAHYGLTPSVGALLDGRLGQARTEALLLPTSQSGYRALCRAITARHADPEFGKGARRPAPEFGKGARRPAPEFGKGAQRPDPEFDIGAQLAGDGGDLLALSGDLELLEALVGAGGARPYLALREPCAKRLAGAARLGVEVVQVGDVFAVDPGDLARQRVLRAIALKTTLGRLPAGAAAPADGWLEPEEALARRWPGAAGARARALAGELAAASRFGGADWGYGVLTFPRWQGGEGDRRSAIVALRELAEAGARRRYRIPAGGRLPLRVLQRLERELALVEQKGFADYFLIVREIVASCPRTCGRGSAAGSLIAYALGITHVDPVRHDLFFERFLNEARVQPPDIDIDFPWDERDAVLARVFASWGPRAAMVSNHVCFRLRAALREVAKSHGLPEREILEVTRRLPYYGRQLSLGREGHEALPLTRGLELDPPWDRILRLAQGLVGLPRHLSVHPGGVVITPGPLTDHVPVETAAKGVPVIQWEKDGAEEAGLVKIDLLGNRSLAVIRDTLEVVRARGEAVPDYAALAVEDDPDCQRALAKGETMGCFYVESPAMRQLQQKSGRGDFEHLVIHSSIIRPAANEFIREYLRRLHGGPWEPWHPELERTLQGTLGLFAYQEDVARVALALAGFGHAEADLLRKVLNKKSDYRLPDLERRFREGCLARGLAPEALERLWAMLTSFAGYSFCKSHSASYALVSFKCCWLRLRYPAEFLAAVISNGGGYYTTLGYMGEARRLGLTIEPACVEASDWSWRGRAQTLRVGLAQLKGLRRESGQALLEARRRDGPFGSVAALLGRVPALRKDELSQLARAGALARLAGGEHQARLHWRLALRSGAPPPGSLFRSHAAPTLEPPAVEELPLEVQVAHELRAYGVPLRRRPLELWASAELEAVERTAASELPNLPGRRVTVLGWLVTTKLVTTRENDPMEFLTLEDETGLVDVVVFPTLYRRRAREIHRGRPLKVHGRVQLERGSVSLVAADLVAWWGPALVPEPELEEADRPAEDLLEPG